ncbi:hypothetical protein [Anaeromassilibacillus sp. SJQ-1]|uniref:hypothetical protein n=1 Tax=Anaeromassilibacillus sp. SJQ-1 TaxID=3375419 RepID=UPI003988BA3C
MMARSGAFGKKGKFLGAGIAVLAVLSMILYYGVASGTDFFCTDRPWSFEPRAKILVLGLSIAMIVYLGIYLLKNQLSLRRYTLLAWGWFVIFLLFAGLFAVVFPSSVGSGWSICIWAFPKMVWASILMAALGGFRQMAAGRQTAPPQGGSIRCLFLQERGKYGWFAAAALAGVLAEGACRIVYFMGNQAVISRQDMAFFSWASNAGTFLDGLFLALSKWLLAGLAVLLFYGRMRLSTYLAGNALYFAILFMVLPTLQWLLDPMFVQNVVFSVGLSLVGGIEIVFAVCLLYLIAAFMQEKKGRTTG